VAVGEGLSQLLGCPAKAGRKRQVEEHLESVFQKLGARDRTQAVTLALQRGIIHLDE